MREAVREHEPRWLDDIESALNRFPIHITERHWSQGTENHYQPGIEIHMIHDGEGTMVVGRQVLLQSARSVLAFRGSVPHQMLCKAPYRRSVICIHGGEEMADPRSSLLQLVDFSWIPHDACLSFALTPKRFQQLEDLCDDLRRELDTRRTGWERLALAQVLQMTVLLQRSAEEDGAAQPEPKNELIQRCSDYVCSHLDGDLSLRAVSKRFAVSGEYLTRSFTKEMGISFYQYVLLQRVAEGRRLLAEAPDLSIADIACSIGFPSPSHFSRHFKKLTEQTPSAYRRKLLGEDAYS